MGVNIILWVYRITYNPKIVDVAKHKPAYALVVVIPQH